MQKLKLPGDRDSAAIRFQWGFDSARRSHRVLVLNEAPAAAPKICRAAEPFSPQRRGTPQKLR